MRKYNPALSNLVSNWRQRVDKQEGFNFTSKLSNEELFNIIEYWSMLDDEEQILEAIVSDIKTNQKR